MHILNVLQVTHTQHKPYFERALSDPHLGHSGLERMQSEPPNGPPYIDVKT